jgi:FKBP-type peptidyl-prolyl cis-trans isomerase
MNVNAVIPGFQEALQLMVEGDKWIIHIPSQLAYGERGVPGNQFSPGIQPNSMLKFELEVVKVLGEESTK